MMRLRDLIFPIITTLMVNGLMKFDNEIPVSYNEFGLESSGRRLCLGECWGFSLFML
jgi:hypothetical protein